MSKMIKARPTTGRKFPPIRPFYREPVVLTVTCTAGRHSSCRFESLSKCDCLCHFFETRSLLVELRIRALELRR